MILVIDNYDSFTFNLVQALEAAGATLLTVRNDRLDRATLERLAGSDAPERLTGLLVSPGPGDPSSAGASVEAIAFAAEQALPTLGVCLGLQCLAVHFGGAIVRAPTLVHGEARAVDHDGSGLLCGLPSPFEAARYHSLCVDPDRLPPELLITARSSDGVVMAVRHRELPLEGVQFHPESVLTPAGPRVLANFLRRTGDGDPAVLEAGVSGGFARNGLPTADRGATSHGATSHGDAGDGDANHGDAGTPLSMGGDR